MLKSSLTIIYLGFQFPLKIVLFCFCFIHPSSEMLFLGEWRESELSILLSDTFVPQWNPILSLIPLGTSPEHNHDVYTFSKSQFIKDFTFPAISYPLPFNFWVRALHRATLLSSAPPFSVRGLSPSGLSSFSILELPIPLVPHTFPLKVSKLGILIFL